MDDGLIDHPIILKFDEYPHHYTDAQVKKLIHYVYLSIDKKNIEYYILQSFYYDDSGNPMNDDEQRFKELTCSYIIALDIQANAFYVWYQKLLDQCKSCLTRDVLRQSKNDLYYNWMNILPMEDGEDYDREPLTGKVIGFK